MTDPAPPVRTPLTPEGVYPRGMLDFMEARCPSALAHGNAEGAWKVDCAPCFAEFVRDAFTEARLAGLEDAVSALEAWRIHEGIRSAGPLDPTPVVRSLAADALKPTP